MPAITFSVPTFVKTKARKSAFLIGLTFPLVEKFGERSASSWKSCKICDYASGGTRGELEGAKAPLTEVRSPLSEEILRTSRREYGKIMAFKSKAH